MKSPRFFRLPGFALILLCSLVIAAAVPLRAEVTMDGNVSGDGYSQLHNQLQPSGTNQNALANLRYLQFRDTLHLFIAGRARDNAIILFIDSKPGGVNRITPNLIAPQPGGEEASINHLGLDATHGMTFESGFNPDHAIRILGDEINGIKHAIVDHYDLVAGTHASAGDAHGNKVSAGPIRALITEWQNIPSNYATCNTGVELALNLSELGVAAGSQSVKISAILVNPASTLGTNQVLGSLSNNFNMGINGVVTTVDFQMEPAIQTLAVPVTGLDPALDEDGDGLANGVETGTGIFVTTANTGTDPYVSDSDGDGYPDGQEVAATSALGFPSNPNIPNSTNIGVTGSFNLPSPWQPNSNANSPPTSMTRESTSLTGQYRWSLDYQFRASQLGAFDYKFSTNGSLVNAWGLASTPGLLVRGGNNIPGYVSATGCYRFFFDQATLSYSFGRRVFANAGEFLAAYGLTADGDSDGDGIANQNEFTANTDPTNPDSDGDGLSDLSDTQPLSALRDIVFSVDMHVQVVNGDFIPGHAVKVMFLSGIASPGELLLTDPDGDDIYTGTFAAAEGPTSSTFAEYKFLMVSPYYGDYYEDYIPNRILTLGTAQAPQILPTVFFNDLATTYAYDNWASAFSTGLPADDSDGDSIPNYQEFLFGTSPLDATTGAGAALKPDSNGLRLRWLQRSVGASYRLEESTSLQAASWSASALPVEEDTDQSNLPEGYVRKSATIPLDAPYKFLRVAGRE